jgi:hypothetical protein
MGEVSVWCERSIAHDVEAVLVWRGEWPFSSLPAAGDGVALSMDWGVATVKRVVYTLEGEHFEIVIGPDVTGEYAEYAREKGVEDGTSRTP